ncbi:MAG: type I-F CRISPR-associated protein Csy1 [Porticoccaceae bacterium]|nr:type I-F CRISPR-associated protein Csy1 [Porticoccaceae bacterium]
MEKYNPHRVSSIRAVLERHVTDRLNIALKKLEGKEDSVSRKEREKALNNYRLDFILEEGAKYANQVQIATHIVKGTHPDPKVKNTSNLNVNPESQPQWTEVGSHILNGNNFSVDATGNGAVNKKVYEAYLLLGKRFDGESILDLLKKGDSDAISALHHIPNQAKKWAEDLVSIDGVRSPELASHTLSKQLYWLVGNDPADDSAYHLLAPLYATSLAHAVYGVLQEDRFGEANKAARQARRERKPHQGVFRDYPDLAVQKMGGTKPQNISQLNSERGGNNYLLGSLPPKWRARDVRMPWHVSSVFERIFGRRDEVRNTIRQLLRFLESDPASTMDTRNQVDSYVDTLIDELVQMAGEFQRAFEPGWSLDKHCELARAEQLWLDPLRAESDEEFRKEWLWMDWPAQIGGRFANWLNSQLEGKLPVGDAEHRQWKKELLVDESPDGWARELQRLRKKLDAPRYIPVREGVE